MCFATVLMPTAAELKELIACSPIPVIVEVGADWSPPAQLQRPFIRKLAIDLGSEAHVATIDIQACRDLQLEWNVTSIPQILQFRHGQLVDRVDGVRGYIGLRTRVAALVGSDGAQSLPEEAIFVASVRWAEAIFEAAARPADETFRLLWAPLATGRDRVAASLRAAAARGEITAEEARSRLREEETRLMGPLQPQLAAAAAEGKALRMQFVEAIDEAVEIYAAAVLCRTSGGGEGDRPSA